MNFLSLMFFILLLLFINTLNHALSTLLTIEFLALTLYLSFSLTSEHFLNESFCSLYFLTLAVCESALGLSLVVVLARTKGSNLMSLS